MHREIPGHREPWPTGSNEPDSGRSEAITGGATLANLEKLEAGSYIERSAAAGHAYDYRVRILLDEPTS